MRDADLAAAVQGQIFSAAHIERRSSSVQAFDAFASSASSSKDRRKSCRSWARFSKRARF
jgi:hypothetical protein